MGNDLISELPDSLITQILLWLPTKDSVRTSVLSTRWRNLWLDVPGLDLNSDDFPDIIKSFTERFFEFNNDSRLQNFKMIPTAANTLSGHRRQFKIGLCGLQELLLPPSGRTQWASLGPLGLGYLGYPKKKKKNFKMINNRSGYNYVCGDTLKELIATAVDSGIQHLDFETSNSLTYLKDFMPMNIYKSKTLVSLKLVLVMLENPEFVVSLPCLKIMHLKNIWYDRSDHGGPLIVEKLISGCPVLEDLTVMRILDEDLLALLRLHVRSLTLKILDLKFGLEMFSRDISVEIDAPKLKYMSFGDRQSNRIMVKNLSSLFKIDLDTELGGSPFKPDSFNICDFLTGISSVRHMIISPRTLEVIYLYSELGPIPKFRHLSHLKATISSLSLKQLLAFLESCPNLKNLILDFSVSMKSKQIDLTSVPRCMTSTLECVEINKLIRKEETGIKVVKFFHENSPFLKNLKLRFTDHPPMSMTNKPINRILKKYLTTRKRSHHRCQVTIS